MSDTKQSRPIAIVGAACRFAGGAVDLGAYWDLLRDGVDAVGEIGDDRWATWRHGHPQPGLAGKSYTWAASTVDGIDQFEPGFFEISPREAVQMDPQQRLLLEMAWEALESGSQVPAALSGSNCGVYIGISATDHGNSGIEDPASADAYTMSGNALSTAANRISHFLNLHGPSMAIDTACSSSLVAIHQACRSLWNGEVDLALAGGMHLLLSPMPFIGFSAATMVSPTGRSRSFDAKADGYVRGEGGGVILLKPLDDALADGDPILATILATAVNTSGKTSAMTVPSGDAQRALLKRAYADADVPAGRVTYIEAHGTGTPVGDPIEAQALGETLGCERRDGAPLAIGSVKSNLGHLEPAAGIAGLLKVVLQLRHRQLAPSLHLNEPNPAIDFSALNLRVVTKLEALEDQPDPHVMGVTASGFGGANAHIVLAQAPSETPTPPVQSATSVPLVLSAHSDAGLRAMASNYADLFERLDDDVSANRFDVAWTAVSRRQRFRHRLVLDDVLHDLAPQTLRAFGAGESAPGTCSGSSAETGPVVFVFSGNGSQWAGMGAALLAESPLFRDTVAEVQTLLPAQCGIDLAAELQADDASCRFAATEIAQPALFVLQVGVVRILRKVGLTPDFSLGHSVGEIAAAWAAGALTLAEATRIIIARSEAQAPTRRNGRMAALSLPRASAQALIERVNERLEIAAVNSPQSVTVAGPDEAISALDAAAKSEGVPCIVLDLEYAFHSQAMDGIREPLLASLAGLAPAGPMDRFISTVDAVGSSQGTLDPEYWWRNIRQSVRFDEAIHHAVARGATTFIEIGPRAILRRYVRELSGDRRMDCIPTLSRSDSGAAAVRAAAWQAFCDGRELDLAALFDTPGRVVALPTYPWQRERYWVERTVESTGFVTAPAVHPLLGSALARDELVWERDIDPDLVPWLGDHRVQGVIVFPGAAYAELALAAGVEAGLGHGLQLHELSISVPMLFRDRVTRTVRVNLDPEDGRLTIRSRQRLTSERWTLHAHARVSGGTHDGAEAGPRRVVQAAVLASAEEISAAEHYAVAGSVQLDYGPAFRSVGVVRCGAGVIEAELGLADTTGMVFADYHLPPPLLDGAIQTLLHLGAGAVHPDRTYVPVSMQRVMLNPDMQRPVRSRAHFVSYTSRTVLADIELIGRDGALVAYIAGCRLRAVSMPGQSRSETLPIISPSRQLTSVVSPLERAHCLEPEAVASSIRVALDDASTQDERARYHDECVPLLEALGLSLLKRQLVRSPGRDGAMTGEAPGSYPASAATHQSLHERVIGLLTEHGLAHRDEITGGDVLDDLEEFRDPSQIWTLCARDFPEQLGELTTLPLLAQQLCATPASDELADALSALTRDGGAALSGSVSEMVARSAALASIRHAEARWPENRQLRILDCGGSAGWLAQETPDADALGTWVIAPSQPEFTRQGQALAAERGLDFLSHDDLDGERVAEFDIIAVACPAALGGTSSALWPAIDRRLAEGGLLVAYGQRPLSLFSLALEASLSAHPSGLPGEQIVRAPADFWWGELERSGFRDIEVVHEREGDASPGSVFVLVAQAPEAESIALGTLDTEQIELAVDVRRAPGGSEALVDALRASIDEHNGKAALHAASQHLVSRHVVFVAPGLGNADGGTMAGSPEAWLDAATESLRLLTNLQDAPEPASGEVRLMFVLPATPDAPGAAMLRGLARVAMNELPHLACQIVTVNDTQDGQWVARQIVDELLRDDAESEVEHTRDGRFVLRFDSPKRQNEADRTPLNFETTALNLTLVPDGGLRKLHWRSSSVPRVGEGDVLIRPQATGLNFRDVMFAQGILQEEMLDGGMAGATLGLECAGEVVAVGKQVENIAPGDRVMCFAGNTFSSHVVVPADACQPMPDDWSFAEAATVPTAFFTALYALGYLADIGSGDRVLIHGAAGGVGLAAIQYAQHVGAEIYATAGSASKRALLDALGVEHVYDSRTLQFAQRVLDDTAGEGVDVVLNCLSGEALRLSLEVLRPFGRFLELGKRDIYENSRIGLRPFRDNVSYFCIDVDQLFKYRPGVAKRVNAQLHSLLDAEHLSPLPHKVFPAREIVSAFTHMQQSQHVGKVVVDMTALDGCEAHRDTEHQRLVLRSDATYLITGGTSGLGLAAASWLADRGARHIALMSRHAKEAQNDDPLWRKLAASGAQLHLIPCDVGDGEALRASLRELARNAPRLRGILHAAAHYEDAVLSGIEAEQFKRVLTAKAGGAWYLHEQTRDFHLDFFVVFSSVATMLGSPGQGSYVAANSYVEALIEYRRARGLPGLAVGFGPIGDVGYLARRPDIRERLLARTGTAALDARVALDNLDGLISGEVGTAILANFDWSRVTTVLPIAGSPAFAKFADAKQASTSGSVEELRLRVLGGSFADAQELVLSYVRRALAEVLRSQPEGIDPDASTFDLGLDSLMGMELLSMVEDGFGEQIPVLLLAEGPSPRSLAEEITRRVRGVEAAAEPGTSADHLEVVKRLAQVHGEEVDSVALSELADELTERSIEAGGHPVDGKGVADGETRA